MTLEEINNYDFKVGDRIRVLDTENVRNFLGHRTYDTPINKVFELTEDCIRWIKDNPTCFCFLNNKYGVNFRPEDIELVDTVVNNSYDIY